MKPSPTELRELLRALDATAEREIDCGEFLARVAAWVESLSDTALSELEPSEMAQHLKVCPECLEEFEALLESYREG